MKLTRRNLLGALLASPFARFISVPKLSAAPALQVAPLKTWPVPPSSMDFMNGMQICHTLGAPSVASFTTKAGQHKLGETIRINLHGEEMFSGTVRLIETLVTGVV